MLLASTSLSGWMIFLIIVLGWGVIFRAAGRFALNNPEKTATAFRIAKTFLKK